MHRDSGQASAYPCNNALFSIDKKGAKEPVHSRDDGRYAKACPESRGIATVSLVCGFQMVMLMCR